MKCSLKFSQSPSFPPFRPAAADRDRLTVGDIAREGGVQSKKRADKCRLHSTFPSLRVTGKLTVAIVLCNVRTILLFRQFSRLYFQVCFRVHSQAMVGGGRPPYFWAENDGKKKERATRRREEGRRGGAVTFTDGLKKD